LKKVLIFFAIFFVIIAVLSLILTLTHKVPLGEKVALVRITGVILDSTDVIEELKKYSKDNSIKAIVIRVDSPGGGVAPSQEIYEEILKIKESGECRDPDRLDRGHNGNTKCCGTHGKNRGKDTGDKKRQTQRYCIGF
jgi:hypothetical protein